MYQISAYTDNFDFLYQIFPKMVFAVEKRESEVRYSILQIWSSIGTKFHVKLTICFLGPNLPRKGKLLVEKGKREHHQWN